MQLHRERKPLPMLITPIIGFGVGCGAHYGINWWLARYNIAALLELSPLRVMLLSAASIAVLNSILFHISPASDHWRDNAVNGIYTWYAISNFVAVTGGVGITTYFMQMGAISLPHALLITSAITGFSGLTIQLARRREPGHIIGNTVLTGAMGAAAFYGINRLIESGLGLNNMVHLALFTATPAILSLLMTHLGPFAETWKEVDDKTQPTVIHTANWALLAGAIFALNHSKDLGCKLLFQNSTMVKLICGISAFGVYKYHDKSLTASACAGTAMAILAGTGNNYIVEALREAYTLPLNNIEINIISALVIASAVAWCISEKSAHTR